MVIVKLIGGLGNQLFQYAVARRIAMKNNVRLKLDITSFRQYKLRVFSLGHFCISAEQATAVETFMAQNRHPFSRLINKVCPWIRYSYIRENKNSEFDPDIFQLPGNLYLDGYWQSEKYFKDIEDIIRQEFQVKHKPDPVNQQMAQDIHSTEAVSMHIRRGDYVTNQATNERHGICSLEYYHTAIRELTRVVKNPCFYIFTDDPEWARDNLHLDYPVTFVTQNGAEKDYEDLRLMTFCKHHIIANSSFSWWGAWLSANPGKIVFAPMQWFRSGELRKDLIPDNWHRI